MAPGQAFLDADADPRAVKGIIDVPSPPMNEPNSAVPVSGRALLIRWANDQDDWVREIVGQVLEANAEPDAGAVQRAYEHMLVEMSLATGTRMTVPSLVEGTASRPIDPPLALVSIEDIKNVNALATGQNLALNARMTVLFGRNGSGKTGYARVLKRLSSVRREQRILPDITVTTPTVDPPEAKIRYTLGGVEETMAWKGAAGVSPFTRIDVFDAQDAPTYVDGDLMYVYAPTDVALFRHVAAAMEGVRSQLEDKKRERAPGSNVFAGHFKRTIPFHALIDALGATTDLAPLRTYACITGEEEAMLGSVRETIETLGAQAVQVQLRAAQADLDLCLQAKISADRLVTLDVEAYDAALASLKAAEKRHVAATRSAFAHEIPPGFLTPEWRAFVEAGQHYTSSLELRDYPAEREPCVYCRQPLNVIAAVDLLTKYRDFCDGELERAIASELSIVDRLRRPLATLDVRPLEESLRRYADPENTTTELPPHASDARLILDVVQAAKRMIAGNEPIANRSLIAEAQNATNRISEAHNLFDERVTVLKGKTDEREGALARAHAEREFIEARITLRSLLPSIETFVAQSRWVSVADGVLRRLKIAARALTDVSKHANEQLVNQDFEKHFREECKLLNAPHVKLDFKGQKGAAARRKQLRPEYRLTDTLSEGEQKVIALADFLAETNLRTTNAPVVFDDPVTSLDYERIREVASRLATLAQRRQVIVFTHNIWFVVEILERFRDRRDECFYYDIKSLEGRRGVVTGGTHPRSDSINDLRKRLNIGIGEARKTVGETQDALVFRGYAVLRALCEVAVESEFLQGVVRRYEPNVRLTVLTAIKPLALKEAADTICPVYEETCRYIEAHSQPMEHLNVIRTVDELEKDYRAVLAAIDGYKKALA